MKKLLIAIVLSCFVMAICVRVSAMESHEFTHSSDSSQYRKINQRSLLHDIGELPAELQGEILTHAHLIPRDLCSFDQEGTLLLKFPSCTSSTQAYNCNYNDNCEYDENIRECMEAHPEYEFCAKDLEKKYVLLAKGRSLTTLSVFEKRENSWQIINNLRSINTASYTDFWVLDPKKSVILFNSRVQALNNQLVNETRLLHLSPDSQNCDESSWTSPEITDKYTLNEVYIAQIPQPVFLLHFSPKDQTNKTQKLLHLDFRNSSNSSLELSVIPKSVSYEHRPKVLANINSVDKYLLLDEPNAAPLVQLALKYLQTKSPDIRKEIVDTITNRKRIRNPYKLICFTQNGQYGNLFKQIYFDNKIKAD